MTYYPPRVPNPKKDAERRRQLISRALRWTLWIAACVPLLFMLMAYGYSDQAPAALRDLVITVDSFFGRPVWSIIAPAGK